MSVDLIDEQNQLSAHRHTFSLWTRQWAAYNLSDQFHWEIYPFQQDQIENIPREPGIYSFVIQPGIASYPECSYLIYIGKTERTLRQRFKEYFCERRDEESGRPKIFRFLNLYEGYLHFCCSTIQEKERLTEIEDALSDAFLPICNKQFSSRIRRIIGAFQ